MSDKEHGEKDPNAKPYQVMIHLPDLGLSKAEMEALEEAIRPKLLSTLQELRRGIPAQVRHSNHWPPYGPDEIRSKD